MSVRTHTSKDLTLEIEDIDGAVVVSWFGESTAREPAVFIGPLLSEIVVRSAAESRKITLDFRKLRYMNSSTISPIIRLLSDVREGTSPVQIIYNQSLKWQELRFSALRVFETPDRRVQIVGRPE